MAIAAVASSIDAEDRIQTTPIEWPSLIEGDGVKMHRITGEESPHFKTICSWYKISPEELTEELDSMVLWCICDSTDQPVGTLNIEADLHEQVTDKALAEELFNQGKTLEISYSIIESRWNQGWGKKAVRAWMDEAGRHPYGKCLFAVVDEKNQYSIQILQKSGFHYHGNYFHSSAPEVNRLIYIS